jgi:acid stress chaperone HdeB
MAKLKINISGLILLGLMSAAAQAEVTVDVAKISCEQFRGYAITDPNNIALWLSGYYSGKRGSTIVNVQVFKENLQKVKDYCITNPKVTVMQAVEEILGKDK